MSLKRPFGKVRKIQRKQDDDGQKNDKIEQKIQIQQKYNQPVSKTPVFTLGSKKPKPPLNNNKNVYDILKKNQNVEENVQPTEVKQSINIKPDLLKKKGVKLAMGQKLPIPPPVILNNQDQSTTSLDGPKPTPLFRGKKANIQFKPKSRQKIILEEPIDNQNQFEGSQQNSQDSTQLRPDFRTKNKIEITHRSKAPIQQQSFKLQQQDNNHYINYIPIQPTQINIEVKKFEISQQKLQKQKIRTNQLKKILNLQLDMYEQLVSIACVTGYQVYINKIKNGTLKNSNDQSFDQKNNQASQTLPLEFVDYGNQCPQDYQTYSIQNNQQQAFNRFILKVSPIIQQLIRPTTQVIMPPIFLLAFKPTFNKFIKCPNPVFIYEASNMGIAVIGQKLYISQHIITSVLLIGSYYVGGLINGKIVLWTGKNEKNITLYHKIFQIIQSTNFQLPSYINQDLDRYSLFESTGKILSLVQVDQNQLYSLDQHGKLVRWRIQLNIYQEAILKPLQSANLSQNIQRDSLICYQLKYRYGILFISSSQGILVWHNNQLTKKLEISKGVIIDFQLPKRSTLVYVICSDNSLYIFDQNYSSELFSLIINTIVPLNNIIIPQIQHQNKQISILSHFYISNKNGYIYEINLLQNTNEHISIIQSQTSNRSILYKTVNCFNNQLQVITLMNDLRFTKNLHRMGINLQKTIPNLKKVLEANRRIHSIFDNFYAVL